MPYARRLSDWRSKATRAYRLPCRYVIHTPGPIWRGGRAGEAVLLAGCYQNCLRIASELNCKTVAFPSISTGVYRFPLNRAAEIAIRTIEEYLSTHAEIEQVSMICFDETTLSAYQTRFLNGRLTMSKNPNQKLKLLYLYQILLQRTDENHKLTTDELRAALERCGITAERKSIYSDIEALQNFGLDVICQRGTGGGYYVASREFELPELKLLVDAIQCSRFITEKNPTSSSAKSSTSPVTMKHIRSSVRCMFPNV